jgi:hypothetical protein
MSPRRQSHLLLKRLRIALEAQRMHVARLQELLSFSTNFSQVEAKAVADAVAGVTDAAAKIEEAIELTDETTVVGFLRRKKPP